MVPNFMIEFWNSTIHPPSTHTLWPVPNQGRACKGRADENLLWAPAIMAPKIKTMEKIKNIFQLFWKSKMKILQFIF